MVAHSGGYRHVLGGGREPDDVRPVVGKHRLVPRDAQLQLRVGESHPRQHVHHPRPIVVVRDGSEELVERCDRHVFSLGDKHAGQLHFVLCYSTLCTTKGAARAFPRAAQNLGLKNLRSIEPPPPLNMGD